MKMNTGIYNDMINFQPSKNGSVQETVSGRPAAGTAAAEAEKAGLRLEETEKGLVLTDGRLSLMADLSHLLPRLRHHNLSSELLVKAARIRQADHPLTAIDATAGLGEDSLLLAAAGFRVTMYEHDPVIAALLRDALARSTSVPELSPVTAMMTLVEGDSIAAMNTPAVSPDIILLDPMFPSREKSSLIKKKFQLLQQLEMPCSDEESLLNAAVRAHPHKIIIKRPLKGPFLSGRKPSYSVTGKSIRYDCIVLT